MRSVLPWLAALLCAASPAQDDPAELWSLRPPKRHDPPAVRDPSWARTGIDPFILKRLEAKGLRPSAPADRRTLLRRVTFDLVGLPPTPEEADAFLPRDPRPGAYERLVDRLLASPHHGERWGRAWLDLARYSDSTAKWLKSVGQAWLYRDWVVRAFNEDLPYDRFVLRQLATDLMEETGPEDYAALGFLGLSPTYWKELRLDKEVIKVTVAEEWEERVDAVSRTFLGLSVSCARCHDHKFDPVTMKDYYALAGVIAGTRLADRPLLPPAEAAAVRKAHAEVAALEKELKKLKGKQPKTGQLRKRIEELKRTPHYGRPVAHAVEDAALYVRADGPHKSKLEYKPGESRDLAVHRRGNPSVPGPVVPRRFLGALSGGKPRAFGKGSGRLDLARAIVTEGAPLSARVIVNRVWRHHFGRGLVETPSDFGTRGARPSHPALLDDLTARFIERGWSIKWLHREILLSAAWRQSSAHVAAGRAADPDNLLLWRMNRRRLEIEPWRDAMLVAAGRLDRRIGGAPAKLGDAANRRRTIYGRIERRDLDRMLALYDFPDPTAHGATRPETTTPLQQLFVLNAPFIRSQAEELVRRLPAGTTEARVRRAYRILFTRPPTPREEALAVNFIAGPEKTSAARWRLYAQALLGSNEFLHVD